MWRLAPRMWRHDATKHSFNRICTIFDFVHIAFKDCLFKSEPSVANLGLLRRGLNRRVRVLLSVWSVQVTAGSLDFRSRGLLPDLPARPWAAKGFLLGLMCAGASCPISL